MGDGGSIECLSQAFGVCSRHCLCSDALSSWLTLGASMGPTSPSSPGPVGDFISGLLVLPALVLVVSGLKRAICAL